MLHGLNHRPLAHALLVGLECFRALVFVNKAAMHAFFARLTFRVFLMNALV